MKTIKKDDPLSLKIRVLQKSIKEKVMEDLSEKCRNAKKEGKYPWEGMWLTPESIRMVQEGMRKKDRVVFAEIMFLFLLLVILAFFLFGAIDYFLPVQNNEEIKTVIEHGSPHANAGLILEGSESAEH